MTTPKYVIVICVNDEGATWRTLSEHVFCWYTICEETLNLIDDNQVEIIKNWLQINGSFVTFDK